MESKNTPPEPGDMVRATRVGGSQTIVGILEPSDSPLDIYIRRWGRNKITALVAADWKIEPAREDSRRYLPVRVTPVTEENLVHHLWANHGIPLEQVKTAPVDELVRLHEHLHANAARDDLTLNHIHGMTPSEERLLQQGLEP